MFRTTLVAIGLFASFLPTASAEFDPQTALQLADYIAVDYSQAVVDGSVVNAAEYKEMQEFSARIVDLTRNLQPRGAIAEDADQLAVLVKQKASAEQIAAATRKLRERILAEHDIALTPAKVPDLERGALLYQRSCASCHGPQGRGDGELAKDLDPSPTNFRDHARAFQRSLYGLYNTITLGVKGTGMASFSQLPEADRWALAFYAGGLAATEEELASGAHMLANEDEALPLDLRTMTSWSLREIRERLGTDAASLAIYLRRHPQPLFASTASPFDVAREQTKLAVEHFRSGDRATASAAALSAYLDGYELVENSVSAVDPTLARQVETDMSAMRAAIGDSAATLSNVEKRATTALASLDDARRVLSETDLTPAVVYTSSLVILLREGLEAILILAAIAAFMIKTGRREALIYLHFGWVAALALGFVTWAVSTWLLEINGATREFTEGMTALFAAVILFYVGFWMHGKLNAQRWNKFLHENIGKALEGGTLWTLTLVSFIAVYREVFETVLFYQALWTQTGTAGQTMVFVGAGTAAALLVLCAWLIFKLGVRLPLRQFFGASAAVMILLSIVFAGKGVAALQEAGKLPTDAIAFVPRIEMLGIFPNWESLGLQLALVAIAVGLILQSKFSGSGPGRMSASH